MSESTAVAEIYEPNVPAPETPANTAVSPMAMIGQAINNGVSPEMLGQLMDLQERHERNLGRKAFDNAIAAAKAEIPPIIKAREVDFTSSKGRTNYQYEDLATIAKVVDPILGAHGLSYRFRTEIADGIVTVTCILSHRDGYSEETALPAPPDNSGNKNSIQAVGSTVTYLQRYTLKAALGLSSAHDDDDGQGSEASEPISEERAAHIRKELAALGADEAAFCEYLNIPNLMEMPSDRFSDACKALAAKRRKAEKEAAQKAKAQPETLEFPGDQQ